MTKGAIERFWEKVRKTSTCWIWTASKRAKGYGAYVWANDAGNIVQGRAHRFSYVLFYGPIPEGVCVLHTCDNPACVNPEHLWLGSNADNNKDMCLKGRHVSGGTRLRERGLLGDYERGENHHGAILTEKIVRSARKDKRTMSYSQLAAKYKVTPGALHAAVTRRSWRHVI